MATISKTPVSGSGVRGAVETILTATNGFTFAPGTGQILILRNPTAAAITSVIKGAESATVPVTGVGNVDVSTGYQMGSIAAAAVRVIPLDTISAYCQGAITITGTGLVAILLGG